MKTVITHKKIVLTFTVVLIGIGLFSRLVNHEPNFTALGAIALLSGVLLPKRWGFVVPAFVLLLSDMILGFYSWKIMIAVYASFALIYYLGQTIRPHKSFTTVLGGSVLGGVLFFAVTNWAVWVFGSMYPATFDGLMQSYFNALSFFRNTLLGNVFYGSLVYSAYAFVAQFVFGASPAKNLA